MTADSRRSKTLPSQTLVAVWVVFAAFVVSVVLTVLAVREHGIWEMRRELATLGLEDVSRRVVQNVHNLRRIRETSDAVALSRAKAFARLIAADPAILLAENRASFESLADDLGVDELHVTDGEGVLIRSLPAKYEGLSMADSEQSAVFLPAVTNRLFALVQDPMYKGLESSEDVELFQYAGVARQDQPGIVQIGYRARRVSEAMKLADIGEIAATSRVGRDGRVVIVPLDEGMPVLRGLRFESEGDRRFAVFETDCEGYRISVRLPASRSPLAAENAPEVLLILSLILLVLFFVAAPTVRRTLAADFVALRTLLAPPENGRIAHFRRFATSPIMLSGLLLFFVVIGTFWICSKRSARADAEERLFVAAEDIRSDMLACVDNLLVFEGRAICNFFGTPEAMVDTDLREALKTYLIDELNVIDGRGYCVASTIAIVGHNQWKKPKPAEFNKALLVDGLDHFSQAFRESATEPGVFRKYVGVAFTPPAKGYVQLGFDQRRIKNGLDFWFGDLARGWHIGETGFFIVSDTETGTIVSSGVDGMVGETLASVGIDAYEASKAGAEGCFTAVINGRECLCTSGIVNRYHRYVAVIPCEEFNGPVRRTVFATAIVFLLVLVLVVFFMTRLSDLVTSLRVFITKDNERRAKDLSIAKTIQSSSLPLVFPDLPDMKIFAMMMTAREVGGDFYDFYRLPSSDRMLFLVADVSGKGIPAAMFMMKARTVIKACVFSRPNLADAIAEANARLAENNEAEMFVTVWVGCYDPSTGDIEFVNAGHNPPLVKRADGRVEWLRSRSGLVLGAMAGVRYRSERLHLEPGDSILLYTDGVTEAMNAQGELFGEDRLERLLASSGRLFVGEILERIRVFAEGAEQSDDITMLALDRKIRK